MLRICSGILLWTVADLVLNLIPGVDTSVLTSWSRDCIFAATVGRSIVGLSLVSSCSLNAVVYACICRLLVVQVLIFGMHQTIWLWDVWTVVMIINITIASSLSGRCRWSIGHRLLMMDGDPSSRSAPRVVSRCLLMADGCAQRAMYYYLLLLLLLLLAHIGCGLVARIVFAAHS